MADFRLSIVTSQQTVFDEEITAITLPGAEGSFGVLANHAPIVGVLGKGNVVIRRGNTEVNLELIDGFFEMSNNVGTLLADGMDDVEPLEPLITKAVAQD